MKAKYGQGMRPWECTIKVPNTQSGDSGQFDEASMRQINYSYQTRNYEQAIRERDP